MPKLNSNILLSRNAIGKSLAELDDLVWDRMDEIVKKISSHLLSGQEVIWYWLHRSIICDHCECEGCHLPYSFDDSLNLDDEVIYLDARCRSDILNQATIVLDNKNWRLLGRSGKNTGIPVRWLWEDFEQELIEGKKKHDEKMAKKVKRQTSEKTKLEKTKESIKKKLTKEELALVEFKK